VRAMDQDRALMRRVVRVVRKDEAAFAELVGR
jgi:hypothetical protein